MYAHNYYYISEQSWENFSILEMPSFGWGIKNWLASLCKGNKILLTQLSHNQQISPNVLANVHPPAKLFAFQELCMFAIKQWLCFKNN